MATKAERIEGIKNEIEQLGIRRRQLIQEQKKQDRKYMTRRLCTRAGLMESTLPGTIPLSDRLDRNHTVQAFTGTANRRLKIATCKKVPKKERVHVINGRYCNI